MLPRHTVFLLEISVEVGVREAQDSQHVSILQITLLHQVGLQSSRETFQRSLGPPRTTLNDLAPVFAMLTQTVDEGISFLVIPGA